MPGNLKYIKHKVYYAQSKFNCMPGNLKYIIIKFYIVNNDISTILKRLEKTDLYIRII